MKNARTRRAQQDQGFTLFLVLIVLFLMMLLGITYLRVMRMSSTQSVGSTGNMALVLTRLKQDIQALVGADGRLDVHEPHDYPWTCTRANAPCQLTYPYRVTSGIGMGDPKVDDAWLSPIEAENGKWAQVTNLYGSFLNYADKYLDNIPVNVNTLARVPADAPAGRLIDGMANNQFVVFQDLDAADPRLVDADGDGVGDSLWFYPPESLQGDLRYIAAVRIIDASGLLNLNTALGELGQDPSTVGSGTPRKGEGAYEIDARPLLGGMPPASKTFRQGSIAAGPSGRAPADWTNWDYYWASGGRTTDTGDNQSANRYGALTYEAKLRDHFNEHVDDGSPEAQLWRDYPTLGSNAGNRKYVTTVSGVRDVRTALPYTTTRQASWGWNLLGKRPFDLYANQGNLNIPAPPAGYPAISGANTPPFSYGITGSGAGNGDTYEFYEGNASSGTPDFMLGINSGNPAAAYPFPAGFNFLTASTTASARIQHHQIQMGPTNFHDALGRNNHATLATSGTGTWMGWKPLPILTEFYAQMPYYVCGGSYVPKTGANSGSTGANYSAIYINTTLDRTTAPVPVLGQTTHGAGIGSYALELVNPYQIPIRLANVRFVFRSADGVFNFDNKSPSISQDLSIYVNAAVDASQPGVSGLARDAEGYHVLKPYEKIVFYRNGTDNGGPHPFGGAPDISGLIATNAPGPGVPGSYAVKLDENAPFPAAPDINGHYGNRSLENVELQSLSQNSNGTSGAWINYCRLQYQSLVSGYSGNNSFRCENNIPAGRQGAPGDLVYRQVDVRTFGVDEKLNLLQARPGAANRIHDYTANNTGYPFVIRDWGDCEYRTNTYDYSSISPSATAIAGILPATSVLPPLGIMGGGSTWAPSHINIPGSTIKLSANWMQYDTSLSALGKSVKVAFPTPAGVPLNAMYGGARQDIKNEPAAWWHYVGIPGDPDYPGTFPELTAVGNANRTLRDNSAAGAGGPERRDGLRPLDLLKVPLIGPIVFENGVVGNSGYRGASGWGVYNAIPTLDQLTTYHDQRSIGDAVNMYLAKDQAVNGTGSGLRGLALRTDVPWFDWVNAATKYPSLPYDAATSYAIGQEALSGSDIYVAQQAGTLAVPDPTPGSGNVGPGLAWGCSNGPYARASQFWQASWGEIMCSRWQVDSPKYKGKTGANGDNWKPGMINLNTAPKSVLQCLSLPTGANSALVADKIIAMRKAPLTGAAVAGGIRQGLVLVSEAFGDTGIKSYTADAALLAAGTGTSKFYTSDTTFNLETLSWLPQQATCRSDAFIAYIVVQGYRKDNFNLGPVEVARQILVMTRDGTGGVATLIGGVYPVPLK